MSQRTEHPFPREFAFLPADSEIPWTRPFFVSTDAAGTRAARAALDCVVHCAADVLQALERRIVTMSALNDRLAPVIAATDRAYALFAPQLQGPRRAVEAQTSAGGDPAAAGADGWADLPEAVVIDRVFRVVRVPTLTMGQFAAQVAATSRGVLADLPRVILGIDELTTTIRTITMMFEGLAQHLPSDDGDRPGVSGVPSQQLANDATAPPPDGLSTLWNEDESAADADARTARLASHRWLLGVHLFNLVTLYCRDSLRRSRIAFERSEERAGTDALTTASGFLRGTTAAMWYCGNFSADTYQRHIRPFIVRPGTSDGLSGSEMHDYKHLKAEKALLGATLVARHGRRPDSWPPAVLAAAQQFRATYVEDMEHHMRLAAARIGGDISLAQKSWQAELSPDVSLKNAVDVLRDMAALRRQEFPF